MNLTEESLLALSEITNKMSGGESREEQKDMVRQVADAIDKR